MSFARVHNDPINRKGVSVTMFMQLQSCGKCRGDLVLVGIIHERMEWLLVRPVNLPTAETRLDDHMRIDVTSLPGSDHGPMIDTARLWQLGVRAGAPWRAWIRLAYLWDTAKQQNGGKRVYATRPAVKRGPKGVILDLYGKPVMNQGKPVTDWSDARAVHTGKEEHNPRADRVPMLDTRDLAHLGFDHGEVEASTLRDRATETRRWLREMERLGDVVLEWGRDNVRVLEPRPKGETTGLLINPAPGADGVNSRR